MSRWREVDDRSLLRAMQADDELALDELIRRKTGPLLQLAFRILGDREEARDVVQLAFIRVWDHRERYDSRWSPNTWIYRICNNLAIDHLRSRQSRERLNEPFKQHTVHSLEGAARRAEGSLDDQEVLAIFNELAQELTEKQRSIFVLRELEGLSCREVAEIVGCRESTVRNHLFNSRKALRGKLAERYPEYVGERSREAR